MRIVVLKVFGVRSCTVPALGRPLLCSLICMCSTIGCVGGPAAPFVTAGEDSSIGPGHFNLEA